MSSIVHAVNRWWRCARFLIPTAAGRRTCSAVLFHHRLHALIHEPAHLCSVGANRLGESGIVGGFLGDDTGGREGEPTAVAAGFLVERRQRLAPAGDLGVLVETGVHARHMGLELCGQLG